MCLWRKEWVDLTKRAILCNDILRIVNESLINIVNIEFNEKVVEEYRSIQLII